MIHSLSGGVLSDGEVYTFAKVDVAGTPYWYLASFRVEVGANVLVPFGRRTRRGSSSARRTAPVRPRPCP